MVCSKAKKSQNWTRFSRFCVKRHPTGQARTSLPSFPAFFNHRLTAGTTSGLNVEVTVCSSEGKSQRNKDPFINKLFTCIK